MAHHLLELLEIHIPVAVGVNGLDHPVAILHGALHLKPIEDQVELGGGDEAVFVLVVEIEGVSELGAAAVTGAGYPEGVELVDTDEAVAIGVEVDHDALKLLRRDVGAEGLEDVAELGDGDLAVAVGVKALEDSADLVGDGWFGVGGVWGLGGWAWGSVGSHGFCSGFDNLELVFSDLFRRVN